jgi:hypothetical protein
MSQFLINATAVLKQISHRKETMDLLKNQTWLFFDGIRNDERFFFKDDKEVEIEAEGHKETYKWEFLSSSDKIQVSNPGNSSYFIIYIDKSVVVLQHDLEKPAFAFLVNLKHLQKKEVESYVHNVVGKQLSFSLMHVTDGFDMEIHRQPNESVIGSKGQKVTQDLKPLKDGMYKSSSSSYIYEIKDSIIERKYLLFNLTLSDGKKVGLYTENKSPFISAGDKIILDEKSLEEGKYFTEDAWFIIEKNIVCQTGSLKKIKTPQGILVIEQKDSKPASGDLAYLEEGKPFEGEISAGLFKKIKVSGGKLL